MTTNILKVEQLSVAYGGIQAVKGIAWKSTRRTGDADRRQRRRQDHHPEAITGTLPSSKVAARVLHGQSVEGQEVLRAGQGKLAMVPEGRGVFTRMTIQENLLMGPTPQ
jgi:branched-chain amino acid transport system ATP-binding protein